MSGTDSRRELRFALDQGDAEAPPVELSERVRHEALLARAPGSPIDVTQSPSFVNFATRELM